MPLIEIKKTHPNAKTPTYGTKGAAGFDLWPAMYSGGRIEVKPGEMAVIDLGFEAAIEKGWAVLILPRSGHAAKFRVTVQNAPGLIDDDYRGPWKVLLTNEGDKTLVFGAEESDDWKAVAQGVAIKKHESHFVERDTLESTERGHGGFGSTDEKVSER